MILYYFEVFFFFILCLVLVVRQPLSLGILLLVISFFSSVYVCFFFSSWFSFSLFLVYIGGMLVLFGYVVVLMPNFVFSLKGLESVFLILFMFYFFCGEGDFVGFLYDFCFVFFSSFNWLVYLGLSIVLFIGLISVVKVCFFSVGALRPFYIF